MSLQRGMGMLPELPETIEFANHNFPLGAVTHSFASSSFLRPPAVSYVALRDEVTDQEDTNSCVGCATSTVIYVRGQLSRPIPRPSRKLSYDQARLSGGDVDLVDWGCRPSDAIREASARGLVSEGSWPLHRPTDPGLLALAKTKAGEDVPWINAPPPFDIYSEAFDARLVGYFAADTGDIVANLEAALYMGQIPMFGMRVYHDYQNVTGLEVYDPPSLPEEEIFGLPGHMQAILGYDEEAFLIDSSWGSSHGKNAIVRIRKSFLADQRWCNSRIVVTHVPYAA